MGTVETLKEFKPREKIKDFTIGWEKNDLIPHVGDSSNAMRLKLIARNSMKSQLDNK